MKSSSILFLRTEKKLPSFFFLLSDSLSELNIKLVPVAPRDVGAFIEKEKRVVFSLVQDIKGMERLNYFRNQYLDFYLKNKRLFLIDLSSFGSLLLTRNYIMESVYFHIPLPSSIEKVRRMAVIILKNIHGREVSWPGGKSPKLATQIFK